MTNLIKKARIAKAAAADAGMRVSFLHALVAVAALPIRRQILRRRLARAS